MWHSITQTANVRTFMQTAQGLPDVFQGSRVQSRAIVMQLIYRKTKNLRAVQLLLGYSKLENTVRYLGIEVDDALEISEQIDA
ncbi:hypothetical protein [Methylomonas fluvii]|uniref:hypothetical protein n=1 Tax=Methylomonas fluvii TaxID=1854564 RepID=UPI00352C22B6